MRALEITIWMLMILTAPTLVYSMGFMPQNTTTCTTLDCQARITIFNMANSTQLQEIDLSNTNPAFMVWDAMTFGLTFIVYAAFWMLYLLSTIVLVGPALNSMFHVPAALASWLGVGIWLLWILAYVQYKRGGLGTDAIR